MLAVLTLALTFSLLPGQTAECRAFSRRISSAPSPPYALPLPFPQEVAAPPYTSAIETASCEVRGTEIWTIQPAVGEVVIFSVRAVDPNGAKSPWTGN